MAKLSTKASSQTHRVLIYGAPKTGKSLIAGKLAEFYNLIWFDLENGHETLFQLPTSWQERIELIDLPDTRDYPIAIETCLKAVKGAVEICEKHGKVGCMICKREEAVTVELNLPTLDHKHVVVFDSLTQLTNSAIAHITKAESDDYKLTYDDWGNLGKLMDIFLSRIQQAGYNVICISHETEAETEGKKKTLVPVAGTRNFSRNAAKYFDHVIYAERKNKKHVFSSSTTYATTILTGSRTSARLEDSEEASLLTIFHPADDGLADTDTGAKLMPINIPPANQKPNLTGGAAAKDVLARLRKK